MRLRKTRWREGPRIEWSAERSGVVGERRAEEERRRERCGGRRRSTTTTATAAARLLSAIGRHLSPSLSPLSRDSLINRPREIIRTVRDSPSRVDWTSEQATAKESESKKRRDGKSCVAALGTTAAAVEAFREEERCRKHPQRLPIAPFLQSQRHDFDSCRRATTSRDREPGSRKRQALREIDY